MRYFGFLFVLVSINIFSQPDCFKIDENTNLVYNLNDSGFFSGTCQKNYDNGIRMSFCKIDNGIFKYTLFWDKKGELIDSTIYLDGVKKLRRFIFNNNKLKSVTTYYLSESANDTINNNYDYSDYTYYYKNGNKKREIKMLFDNKNRYSFKYYYKNGNVKESGLAYDKKTKIKNMYTQQMDSTYSEYSKDGKLMKEITYKDGEQIGERKYQNDKLEVVLTVVAFVAGFAYFVFK